MPLGQRVLRAEFTLSGGATVELDETLDVRVRMRKVSLAVQTTATIEVVNLSSTLRKSLLPNINEYKYENGPIQGLTPYMPVSVSAGYLDGPENTISSIFTGQAYDTQPMGTPPNLGVRIVAATNYIDKTNVPTQLPPSNTTFKSIVQWAATQMGVSCDCSTSIDGQVVINAFATATTVGALLPLIPTLAPSTALVFAWIDGNTLYVRDQNVATKAAGSATVTEFLGSGPMWTKNGCEFECLYDHNIRIASLLTLNAKMNPSFNSAAWVPYAIEYDLSSRRDAFQMTVSCAKGANTPV